MVVRSRDFALGDPPQQCSSASGATVGKPFVPALPFRTRYLGAKPVADHWRPERPQGPNWGCVMSWIEKLHRAKAELAKRSADPFRDKVEAVVRNKGAISTAALLDLLDLPKTTGTARRIGQTMRALNFVPIKSRRLTPGGFRDTVARGWARPVREARNSAPKMKPIN
jgi:hypothetical protein